MAAATLSATAAASELSDAPEARKASLPLRATARTLAYQLGRRRFEDQYRAGRTRQPALAPYVDVRALIETLRKSFTRGCEHRRAIVAALLDEHARTRNQLWSGLLVLAFLPVLTGVRCSVRGHIFEPAELDQLTVTAFLAALWSTVRKEKPAYSTRFLVSETRRQLFAQLESEEARLEDFPPTEPAVFDQMIDEEHDHTDPAVRHDAAIAWRCLKELLEQDVLAAFVATRVLGEKRPARPDPSDTAQRRAYQREKARFYRALDVLPSLREALLEAPLQNGGDRYMLIRGHKISVAENHNQEVFKAQLDSNGE